MTPTALLKEAGQTEFFFTSFCGFSVHDEQSNPLLRKRLMLGERSEYWCILHVGLPKLSATFRSDLMRIGMRPKTPSLNYPQSSQNHANLLNILCLRNA